MSVTNVVSIPDSMLPVYREVAIGRGLDPDEYLRSILAGDFLPESIDKIFKGFQDDVEASGMSDEELMVLFEEARNEVYLESER